MIEQFIGISLALGAAGFTSSENAKKKGYDPVIWFFAGLNIFAVLIMMFLPDMEKFKELPEEERKAKQKRGDVIGGVLAGISAILIIILLILLTVNN
jgi:hypothetical protein